LGFPEIVLNGPLFGGDTLYAASEIVACDAADGVVTVRLTGHKPDGAEVARITCRMAIARRDPTDPPRAAAPPFAAHHAGPDGAVVEQCGLFFEDFVAGESVVHTPRRSFYPEEVAAHAWRSLELAPAHQDADWIARSAHGRIRVPEAYLVGAVTALTTRHF